jgi:trehalose/maltose hydrolase-like predicted phosphorylase
MLFIHPTGAMGPDEYHGNVNNSVYTNVAAVVSLRTAQYAAHLTEHTPNPAWDKVASNMHIEYNATRHYHPEFEHYDG